MTVPLGSRTCPDLGCQRRVHVTDGGTVWARCFAHALPYLRIFGPDSPSTPPVIPPSGRRAQSVPALSAIGSSIE